MTILLLDNYDSFTYNLYDYLLQTGANVVVLRHDASALQTLNPADFDGVVLSPGPGRPEYAGQMPALIAAWHQHLPMLGICLGHQALAAHFGALVGQAPVPMHGKTSVVSHNGHPFFEGIPEHFSAMRYHSLVVGSVVGTPLNALAYAEDGTLMALAHRDWALIGVQFHPESILTEHGHRMIANWVKGVEKAKRPFCAPASAHRAAEAEGFPPADPQRS